MHACSKLASCWSPPPHSHDEQVLAKWLGCFEFEITVGGQVVEWVLGSIRSVWSDAAWQQHLASTSAFLARFMPLQHTQQGAVEVTYKARLNRN